MNLPLACRFAALAVATISAFATAGGARAQATFGQQEVEQTDFVAIASPYGNGQHQLLILEQTNNERPCWSESESAAGGGPVRVEPLLLDFDFSGICARSTDGNGYSLRMSGQDLGLDYILRIVQYNGELVLVGTPRVDPNAPDIVVGRTYANGRDYFKIFLEPGWRFAKRTYGDRVLGHIYLATDASLGSTVLSGNGDGGAVQPSVQIPVAQPETFEPAVAEPAVAQPQNVLPPVPPVPQNGLPPVPPAPPADF
ncbi:protein of unknown function (DUF3747) [Rubidibacter lacunae KORDI 51-2]|uniref:DUF3747 domain-containing protein n=1 Tax=Rubidibacter lacunae KORDI 51-2 TaxID=582515 RepID=U5DQQ0_9CHRO|nr:DUF3747 domain-containing protein [Rubidibacter lacunae]ERN42949.1 protein of unknown function (DUF3747) [Rubidibacter lacunae KORDI 51-2]